MPAPDDLDAIIDAGTAMLELSVQPEWRAAIRTHLAISLRLARVVDAFALPDDAEPAPVFEA